MTPLLQRPDVAVYHAAHEELATLPRRDDGTLCDLLCVDAPYSERTHAGHDAGAASANRPFKANGVRDTGRERRAVSYDSWSPDDVAAFVALWAPLTRGWIVSLTDDVLLAAWRAAMADAGRLTFQDVPAVVRGMTVRLTGDGPSSWSIHCAVSRPRSKRFATWGTLPGAYVGPSEDQTVVGGKPLWLMEALIRDYSEPGDIVCDPCCGGGTTPLAALRTGRRALAGDVLREHAELTAERLGRPVQRPLFGGAL